MGRLYNYCGKHAILFCNDATFEKHQFPQHQEKNVAAQQQMTPKMAHFASLQNCLNLLLPPTITCVF